MYNINIHGHMFYGIDAENENEAVMMACDLYYEITGICVYTDDLDIICNEIEER